MQLCYSTVINKKKQEALQKFKRYISVRSPKITLQQALQIQLIDFQEKTESF